MRSPGSSPQDQPVPPHHGASERAPAPREPEPSGSLPPPAIIGLDIGHGPDIDRNWVPPADELEPSASLPDRPPTTLAERAPLLLAIGVGFSLMTIAIILLWRSSMGSPPEPTVVPPGGGQQPGEVVASPQPSPALFDSASLQPATPASAYHLETPSPVVQPEPAPATITIAVSASASAIHGLTAEAAAQALRDALASVLPGQRVELATAPGQATIAIVSTAPPGYRSYLIATAPLAVVTSSRLALTGVSREQAERLLRGEIGDWLSAGAGITLKVEPLALASAPFAGIQPVATYDTYDALVAGFADHPGGVALVPLNEVDWRVNVLAVDGIDLMDGQGDVSAYPFGQRLVAAMRADQPQELHRAVAQAFATLGWPHAMPALTRIGIIGDLSPVGGASPGMLTNIAHLVSAFDLAAISLTGNATSTGQSGTPSPALASGDLAAELARAGIDAISLAASSPQELAALPELLAALHDAGLATAGAGMTEAEARQPLIVERNGIRVAIVAASTGTAGSSPPAANSAGPNRLPPSVLAGDVRQAAAQADIVLVLLHRDGEGSTAPDSELTAAAHLAIDAGAGAVIVSNPGGIGGFALYKERPILFGTGAVTGNPAAVELRQSAIVEMVFAGNRLIRLRLHGIESGPSGRPRLMADDEQAALLDRFWRLSTMRADQSR